MTVLFAGCGGNGGRASDRQKASSSAGSPGRPSGKGVCGLLMQAEVDEIFGTPVGAGASESLEDGSELCSWPANEDPALLLQVGPVVSNVTKALDLGEGYRIAELGGLSAPAAMAVQESHGEAKARVAVVAFNVSDKTVMLSPIGLGVEEGTDRFERLKSLVSLVAKRL